VPKNKKRATQTIENKTNQAKRQQTTTTSPKGAWLGKKSEGSLGKTHMKILFNVIERRKILRARCSDACVK